VPASAPGMACTVQDLAHVAVLALTVVQHSTVLLVRTTCTCRAARPIMWCCARLEYLLQNEGLLDSSSESWLRRGKTDGRSGQKRGPSALLCQSVPTGAAAAHKPDSYTASSVPIVLRACYCTTLAGFCPPPAAATAHEIAGR
jgi:hypothetical protein